MPTPIPNFFIVGAPKSGTTALYRGLGQHPAVFVSPIKEPCFFAPEVVAFSAQTRSRHSADADGLRAYLDRPVLERRDGGWVLEWDQYLKLFKNAKGETAIGEASVSYLGSETAAAAIYARLPGARIAMLLRDPAERLFAQYVALRVAGAVRVGFVDWAREEAAREAASPPPYGSLWPGRFALHLARYRRHFPEAQIHVALYDDFLRDPSAVFRDLFRFLGVAPDWPSDAGARYNETLIPRWPVLRHLLPPGLRKAVRGALPPAWATRAKRWTSTRPDIRPTVDERAFAVAIYEEDVLGLEGLIGRDLSAWRRVGS